MAAVEIQHFLYAVPLVIALGWMLMHEDLSAAAQILILCISLVLIAAYLAYSDNGLSNVRKKQLAAVRLYENESLEETYSRLSSGVQDLHESITILMFLRKKIQNDNKEFRSKAATRSRKSAAFQSNTNGMAVRLVVLGAVQHCVLLLLNSHYSDKRSLACLDFLGEMLNCKAAQRKLLVTEDVEDMRDVVDSFIEWFEVLCSSYMDVSARSDSTRSYYGDAGDEFLGHRNKGEESRVTAVSGQQSAVHFDMEHWIKCCSKALLVLGLMCDDLPAVQTRIGDRGGIRIIVQSLLEQREAMKDVGLAKWTCWMLFNATIGHGPNKSEFYNINGLVLVMDLLKRHISEKDVIRQSLALLFNLISPASDAQVVKYNLSHARHALLAQGIVDTLEQCKGITSAESDIGATSKAILNAIAKSFS